MLCGYSRQHRTISSSSATAGLLVSFVSYKLALITFKALTTHQPQYLSELIHLYEVPRQLRSRGVNILQNTGTTLGFSRRAFCHASPAVWNNLPQSVISDLTVNTDTFKCRLKTALYSRAFRQ